MGFLKGSGMVRPLLALLREKGVDIKSPHRRRATSKMSVARSALEGREARVVLDCGAHHGAMTRAFRAAFPSRRTKPSHGRPHASAQALPGLQVDVGSDGAHR